MGQASYFWTRHTVIFFQQIMYRVNVEKSHIVESDLPPLNCSIHLSTIAAVDLWTMYTFNCWWISTHICSIPIKNHSTSHTLYAEHSFAGKSIFAGAYLAFYWSDRLEIFTVCIETQKLNFPRVSLHFINPCSILARAILTFWMTLVSLLLTFY